jgi:DnaJ-class molecular chaperone
MKRTKRCDLCLGEGEIDSYYTSSSSPITPKRMKCPKCYGVGLVIDTKCNKKKYDTHEDARLVLAKCKLNQRTEQSFYYCKECEAWHLTSLSHRSTTK